MEKYSDYWNNLCQIYFVTKHYLLLAEELSDDFDTFLQPVKEHRDAFDHIARVYGYKLLQTEIEDVDRYRLQNMKKAIGHAYRAFFDTADWLTYICRRKIREIIESEPREEIVRKYPAYSKLKSDLRIIPARIAHIRKNKDISDNMEELIKEVEEYRKILDELLDHYYKINQAFSENI